MVPWLFRYQKDLGFRDIGVGVSGLRVLGFGCPGFTGWVYTTPTSQSIDRVYDRVFTGFTFFSRSIDRGCTPVNRSGLRSGLRMVYVFEKCEFWLFTRTKQGGRGACLLNLFITFVPSYEGIMFESKLLWFMDPEIVPGRTRGVTMGESSGKYLPSRSILAS